jgi:rare lipoprotein A
LPRTTIVKLGAALGAIAIAFPAATAGAQTAAPSPSGGMAYDDPSAPSVFADGSTLAAPLGQLLGGVVRVSGTLAGAAAGTSLEVQRMDARAGWVTTATTVAGDGGSFEATWRSDKAGQTTVRVVPAGQTPAAQAAGVAPSRLITIYRPAVATWYGPGFYGRRTHCGQRMSRKLLGVAHRRLPCGTPVALYKDGRTITVPVVDRGPFRPGTSWDLTFATAKALGITATTTIGAVRAAPAAAPAQR